jgi:hypothetical protein
MNAAATRLTAKDIPAGYTVEKQTYEVECHHPACDMMHRHLYNTEFADGQRHLIDVFDMDGLRIGTRWESRFHMAQRTEWVILLNGVRVGDAHGTKREAIREAVSKPTI